MNKNHGLLGRKLSLETRKKMSEARRGNPGYWKGKKRVFSLILRKKISDRMKGNKLMLGKNHSINTKLKISKFHQNNKWNLGKKLSIKTRLKISLSQRGKNGNNWKGGVSSLNSILRKSITYKLWREAVFKRDGYMCVIGGKEHGNRLHADHIKSFSKYPDLRFSVDNGRTLCISCHRKTDNYGGKSRKNEINN